jgi:hypothetical protein
MDSRGWRVELDVSWFESCVGNGFDASQLLEQIVQCDN